MHLEALRALHELATVREMRSLGLHAYRLLQMCLTETLACFNGRRVLVSAGFQRGEVSRNGHQKTSTSGARKPVLPTKDTSIVKKLFGAEW